MSALRARIAPAASLDEATLTRMFELFEQYYAHVSFVQFCADLARKDDVILLIDDAGLVQGFSTLQNLAIAVDGRACRGLFSGDTVIARAHWGQRVLGRAFLKYLFIQKARRPFVPYYWFLISKGYKTYLLMANNFDEYYPHPARPTPPKAKRILDAFAGALYDDAYDPTTGLIAFAEPHGHLRRGVADITPELLAHPKVAFFQKRNPTWAEGTELACVARMTWSMPLAYGVKAWLKAAGGARALLPFAAPRVRARAEPSAPEPS